MAAGTEYRSEPLKHQITGCDSQLAEALTATYRGILDADLPANRECLAAVEAGIEPGGTRGGAARTN